MPQNSHWGRVGFPAPRTIHQLPLYYAMYELVPYLNMHPRDTILCYLQKSALASVSHRQQHIQHFRR